MLVINMRSFRKKIFGSLLLRTVTIRSQFSSHRCREFGNQEPGSREWHHDSHSSVENPMNIHRTECAKALRSRHSAISIQLSYNTKTEVFQLVNATVNH